MKKYLQFSSSEFIFTSIRFGTVSLYAFKSVAIIKSWSIVSSTAPFVDRKTDSITLSSNVGNIELKSRIALKKF